MLKTENYKTDKGTDHSYIEAYSSLFEGLNNINLLEIGIERGDSLRMWRDNFPDSEIYGIDNNPNHKFEEDRIHCIIGDATNPNITSFFKDIMFDVIIDDGCHSLEAQLASLKIFYPYLKDGGLYIVEDVQNLEIAKSSFLAFGKCTIMDRRAVKGRGDDVLIIYKKMNKKLLLTGGAGFVGHHLIEGVLKQTDWDIVVLDCLSYAGNLNRITDISIWGKEKHRVKFVWHDLKAPISETTSKIIGEVDYIWHLAAESHVGNSLEDAIPFAKSNVVGTTHLLEWIKHSQPNLKKYIGFNTDEVFGPAEEGEYHPETDKFYPSNPYSAAKAGQWCMEYAFAHSFGLPICMTHSMNIFAERQHPEKFIPMVVKSILDNKKVTIHGTPGHISQRHWIHAREVCNGLLFLTEKGEPEESYNIIGEEKDALYIANKISQIIRGKDLQEEEIEYFDFHALRPGHDFRYALDGTKLKELGWQPQLSLDKSLEKTIEWMINPKNQRWLNL